tara:strand:- start:1114 stop:1482 length:369 start_codon:yes stop_codon:yes gene_type:complete
MDENEYEYNLEETEYDIVENIIENIDENIEDVDTFNKNYAHNIKKNITSPVLNKYEKTRVLCERTQQIENGSIPYISNIERFTTSYSIAVEEFNQKKIPFIIRRPLPHQKGYEYWKLKDMEF